MLLANALSVRFGRILGPLDKVDGDGLLWHAWHIPRFSFVLWLASRGRLRTMDKLHNNSQRTCLLSRAQMVWTPAPWAQTWAETVHRFCSKSNPSHKLVGLALASTIVSHLEGTKFRSLQQSLQTMLRQTKEAIIQSIRERLGGINEGIRPPENILLRWNIH
ncbi:hypothetical protein OIU76_025909 [Salix suchowensis]|nr:hypothetical protein OIU76_025909 [Salix suchowensis]